MVFEVAAINFIQGELVPDNPKHPPPPGIETAALKRLFDDISKMRKPAMGPDVEEAFDTLAHESDRGTALVAAAFFEDCLEKLLRARFSLSMRKAKCIEPLFEGFGPLSSYSGKISLAYAFSLIGEALEHDLHIVRKLRNEFAHSITTKDFADPKIQQLIASLYSARFYVPPEGSLQEPRLTRIRFAFSIGMLTLSLLFSLDVIKDPEISMSKKEELFQEASDKIQGTEYTMSKKEELFREASDKVQATKSTPP